MILDEFNPCKNVRVRLGDDFRHPGFPSFNIVVGSGHMLVEIVPVISWEVSINPCGSEVVDQLIHSWKVWVSCWMASQVILTYVSGENATDAMICMNAFNSPMGLWYSVANPRA